jgi:hypothetical protein
MWTFERALGPSFTADVRVAWITAYTAVANIMKNAAIQRSVAAP